MEVKAGYKQTEFGRIPEDWNLSTVSAEFSVQLGKMLDSEKNAGILKPFLGNRAVQWGRIDLADIGAIKLTSSDMQRFRLRDGDLLVCEGGEVGRAAVWTAPISECYYQKALHRLRPKRGYSTVLMLNVIQYLATTGRLESYVTQTSIAHLPKDKFETVPIPVPSTQAEQKAITEALSDADALIESLEQLLAKKRQIKQGATQELLTGRRRLPRFDKVRKYQHTEQGLIPKGWHLRRLLSAVRVANGQVDPKVEPYRAMILVAPDHIESGTGQLLHRRTAGEQQATSGKYMFQSGDIVYSKIRPYLKKAILADFAGLCSADMYPLRAVTGVSAPYVFAVILGEEFSNYAISVSARSGIPKINREELAQCSIAFPPTQEEQDAIAEVLAKMDAEIGVLNAKLEKHRLIKQSMMQQLLTGRIRLVDAKTADDLQLVQSA